MSIRLYNNSGGYIDLNAGGTGSTANTFTLPAETGTVLTNASSINMSQTLLGPAFQAYIASADQSITTSTWATVQANAEVFDTHSCYNTSTYRFIPNVAGYYQFSATLYCQPSYGSTHRILFGFFKNGGGSNGVQYPVDNTFPSGSNRVNGTGIFYMNGTTDYMEFRGWSSGPNTFGYCTSAAEQDGTYWTGRLIGVL